MCMYSNIMFRGILQSIRCNMLMTSTEVAHSFSGAFKFFMLYLFYIDEIVNSSK